MHIFLMVIPRISRQKRSNTGLYMADVAHTVQADGIFSPLSNQQ